MVVQVVLIGGEKLSGQRTVVKSAQKGRNIAFYPEEFDNWTAFYLLYGTPCIVRVENVRADSDRPSGHARAASRPEIRSPALATLPPPPRP